LIHSTRPSDERLVPFIKSLWCYSCEPKPGFETLLPQVGGQLLVNLHGSTLHAFDASGALSFTTGPVAVHGVRTDRVVIESEQKRKICGVEFEPAGLTAFTTWNATRFCDRLIDAGDVWGHDAVVLREALISAGDERERCALLETFLADRLIDRSAEDMLLRRWMAGMRAGARIQDIQNELGLSQRKLHELFDRRIGIRPKLFDRIARLSSSMAGFDQTPSLADLAHDHGFSDQSHLTREFRRFAGTTPRNHHPIDGEPNHVRVRADKMFKTGGFNGV